LRDGGRILKYAKKRSDDEALMWCTTSPQSAPVELDLGQSSELTDQDQEL
jgi:hypothetical protein